MLNAQRIELKGRLMRKKMRKVDLKLTHEVENIARNASEKQRSFITRMNVYFNRYTQLYQ